MKFAPNKIDQARIKRMVAEGKSANNIAAALNIKAETVAGWVKHFRDQSKAKA